MDVDDQVMDLTTHRENQESPVKQSERKKKKSHGNRKLQRYRRNLRKRGQTIRNNCFIECCLGRSECLGNIQRAMLIRNEVRNRSISFCLYAFVLGDNSSQKSTREAIVH